MSAVVLDTETTGTGEDDRIIEFACTSPIEIPDLMYLTSDDDVGVVGLRFSSDKPISLGAMAAHHILEEDLQGLKPFPGLDVTKGVEYIIGHNIDFDWRMMGRPEIKRICTLALARSLWPTIDSHSLTAMVYHVSTNKYLARDAAKGAHSAKADVNMILDFLLPEILIKLVPRVKTWADLWQISEDARIPTIMPMGKHKGLQMSDVPRDYKRWLLNQPDVDPYLAIALRK